MGTPVTWQTTWRGPLAEYLADYAPLIGDRRTAVTFGAVVQGIIGAGSLVCERIAAQSAVLVAAQDGGQRVSRLATGESTQRSQLDAEHLTERLRQPAEVQQALHTVSQAVVDLKGRLTVSWVLDSGFDDVAVWRTIWEQPRFGPAPCA